MLFFLDFIGTRSFADLKQPESLPLDTFVAPSRLVFGFPLRSYASDLDASNIMIYFH